ncbi:MAG: EAL domain-containing protein [Beijerinckiaceae bacterium]|nr:EAL domain-containing protein [Beijerinckiaceae bacterium]
MTVHQSDAAYTQDDLAQALKRNQFTLNYQPIVSAKTARTVTVEALLRMRLPTGHMATPPDFMDVAEQSGFVCDLGEWALQRACADGLNWPGVCVAVNISPKQLQVPGFLNTVRRILNETGFPPDRLELELTEHCPVEDFPRACATLTALRQLGIRVALDDFGVGYSGLIYLRKLPLDKIKIDRAFVESMDEQSDVLVRSIVQLGRNLGLTVTAEGVETSEHQRVLIEAGCHELQGYLFSRPLPAGDIDTLFGCGAASARLRIAGAA